MHEYLRDFQKAGVMPVSYACVRRFPLNTKCVLGPCTIKDTCGSLGEPLAKQPRSEPIIEEIADVNDEDDDVIFLEEIPAPIQDPSPLGSADNPCHLERTDTSPNPGNGLKRKKLSEDGANCRNRSEALANGAKVSSGS